LRRHAETGRDMNPRFEHTAALWHVPENPYRSVAYVLTGPNMTPEKGCHKLRSLGGVAKHVKPGKRRVRGQVTKVRHGPLTGPSRASCPAGLTR
jgi:hypothetical protein